MSDAKNQNAADGPANTPKKSNIGFVVAPLIVFLALATMFGLSLTTGDPSRLPSALIGKPAPKTEFSALEGLTNDSPNAEVGGFTSSSLAQGRVSVVNFWASWCRPCVEEHPHLVALKGRADIDL
ncbi:MAG: redoxin family protein, partial [Pseudomonadota bacterium]